MTPGLTTPQEGGAQVHEGMVGSFRGRQVWQLRGPRRTAAAGGRAELSTCREHSLSTAGGLLSRLGMWVTRQGANCIAESRRGRPVGVR